MSWLRLLTASCEEITRLASQELDRPLTRGERFALRLHLLYCSACRRFRQQIRGLREAMHRMGQEVSPASGEQATLPASSRAAIQNRLEQLDDGR